MPHWLIEKRTQTVHGPFGSRNEAWGNMPGEAGKDGWAYVALEGTRDDVLAFHHANAGTFAAHLRCHRDNVALAVPPPAALALPGYLNIDELKAEGGR